MSQPMPPNVEAALAAGKKIEAIKLYREATGQGLKEAKEAVEAHAAKLVAEQPEAYAHLAQASKSGCASVLAVGLGLGALGVLLARTWQQVG